MDVDDTSFSAKLDINPIYFFASKRVGMKTYRPLKGFGMAVSEAAS